MGSTINKNIIQLSKLREIVNTYSHLNFTCNSLCSVISPLHIVNAYADSGATNTYFRSRDVDNIHKIKTTNPVNVQHVGGNYMKSSHITTLDLHMLGNKNIIGHVLPQLQSASLFLIGQLCDNDCTAYFNKKHSRDTTNGMWKIPVQIPPLLQNNISPRHQNNATLSKITPLQKSRILPPNNIQLHKYYVSFHVDHLQLIKEQINYLYATLFSHAISTF